MGKINSYKLPSSGDARELLREKGQFWTPDWIAEAMVEYVLMDNAGEIFDPAVGAGAFFRAAKTVAKEKDIYITLKGMDIDPTVLDQAIEYGLTEDDIDKVTLGDFVFNPPHRKMPAIVANPPYIRHHRLSADDKERLRVISLQNIGKILDGRAGLHIYFLIRALSLLKEDGRLAFIMPADTCEGKFASTLWRWISENYTIEAVITFSPEASPFPNVDTNPLIFFIRKSVPGDVLFWVRCNEAQTEALKEWVHSGFSIANKKSLLIIERELKEAFEIGLSRPPVSEIMSKYVLGDFVQVVRGVATGANDFFFLTEEQAKQLGIPEHYFVKAIGRTRDVPCDEITLETLNSLREKGRPTLLLSLKDEPTETYPEALMNYIKKGEARKLPERPLISQRKPWYRMETRPAPPFLFAYLGRRNSRFILNTARVIPLTSFLCVYPKIKGEEYLECLWRILSHPDTVANLNMVGKSYGDGAIKVEPRGLERLPIPENVLKVSGIPMQLRLFEDRAPYETTTYSKVKRRKP
ncbi:MAG: N-6 DNA methylase [Chloroflexota bacterium]